MGKKGASDIEDDKEGNHFLPGPSVEGEIFLEDFRIRIAGCEIDSDMAARIMEHLLYLESLAPDREIEFFIDTPGGCVKSGLALYDAIRSVKNPVHTIGLGEQVSMGSILLVAGDKRSMTPNSSLMVHQASSAMEGKTSEMHIDLGAIEESNERLKSIYAAHTGLNHEFWDAVTEYDTWLTPEQALEIGFIDSIKEHKKSAPYKEDFHRNQKGKKSLFKAKFNAAMKHIDSMSCDDILRELNTAGRAGGSNAKYRSRMITKLASFPEMWTGGKKRKFSKKPVSNDNKANLGNKKARHGPKN